MNIDGVQMCCDTSTGLTRPFVPKVLRYELCSSSFTTCHILVVEHPLSLSLLDLYGLQYEETSRIGCECVTIAKLLK